MELRSVANSSTRAFIKMQASQRVAVEVIVFNHLRWQYQTVHGCVDELHKSQ